MRGSGWPGVVARHNHRELVGTVKAGTLKLRVDRQGLVYEVELPRSPWGDDVLELVRRGDVDQSSFAFICRADDWRVSEQGYPLRRCRSANWWTSRRSIAPAYPDTSAGLRSRWPASSTRRSTRCGRWRNVTSCARLFPRRLDGNGGDGVAATGAGPVGEDVA